MNPYETKIKSTRENLARMIYEYRHYVVPNHVRESLYHLYKELYDINSKVAFISMETGEVYMEGIIFNKEILIQAACAGYLAIEV